MDHSSHGSGHSMGDMGGMDMSHGSGHSMGDMGGMDMSMPMTMGTFHWTSTGDALWFDSWMPKSDSAYAGACIGLFVFAIISRGFIGLEVLFVAWRARRFESLHQDGTISMAQLKPKDRSETPEYPAELELPLVPPFSWITDTVRSLLTTFSSFISYLLMLVVMTGNGGFFIVIIIGIFIGEVAFGRFRSLGGHKGGEHDH